MPFRFKQFSVDDKRTAMKVGTDGVLLGAWGYLPDTGRILDVGAGSGLIALMAAQRGAGRVTVDAVEIDMGAAGDAKDNFCASPWGDRMNLFCEDFKTFAVSCRHKYDAVFSNPPYFRNSLLPDEAGRVTARHTAALEYDELFRSVAKLLSAEGRFSLVTPSDSYDDIARIALENSLYLTRLTYVSTIYGIKHKRILSEWGSTPSDYVMENLAIEKSPGHYTEEYIRLVKDFYINM